MDPFRPSEFVGLTPEEQYAFYKGFFDKQKKEICSLEKRVKTTLKTIETKKKYLEDTRIKMEKAKFHLTNKQ